MHCSFAYSPLLLTVGLPFKDASFDYLHQRFFGSSVPRDRWLDLMTEYYRVLAPGGYIEFMDADATHNAAGPAGQRVTQWVQQVAATADVDCLLIHRIPEWLRQAGFTDITEQVVSCPTGSWAGHYGELAWLNWNCMMRNVKGPVLALGVPAWEFERTLSEWHTEVNEYRSIASTYIYRARRPINAGESPVAGLAAEPMRRMRSTLSS